MADLALYTTIWIAAVLLVAGDAVRRRYGSDAGWPWRLWATGAVLCAMHMGVALFARYQWDHAAAVCATARQAEAQFGVGWEGALYVNYAFLALWVCEAIWWRVDAIGYAARPAVLRLATRAVYAVVLFNAAVVFAAPSRRIAGLALVGVLLWPWRPAIAPVAEEQP